MALTHRLTNARDPLRMWLTSQFPEVSALLGPARKVVRGAPTLRASAGNPPSTIGGAIDYRIRYAFGETPPDETVAWLGASRVLSNLLVAMDPENLALWRVVPGTKMLLARPVEPDTPGVPKNAISDFFSLTAARIREIHPAARRLSASDEAELCRLCILLQLFEEVYRTGRVFDGSILASIEPETTAESLCAAVPQTWVHELTLLMDTAHSSLADLMGRRCVLNPTFSASELVGGADADLVIDGLLLELKTTVNPRIDGMWLLQLLGYLLLDSDDELRIREIGFYLVRQGRLVQWPVEQALEIVSGGAHQSLAELRSAFLVVLKAPRDRGSAS